MCSRICAATSAFDRCARGALALILMLAVLGASWLGAARVAEQGPPPAAERRFTLAPSETVREIQATLDRARGRFEARDTAGVLAYVSDQYRSGPLTKELIRQQLLGIFGLYQAVRARVTIDQVNLLNGSALVYTTGEVSGWLPVVNRWVTFLSWEREPEVVRREGSVWRLYGLHDQPAAQSGSAKGTCTALAQLLNASSSTSCCSLW